MQSSLIVSFKDFKKALRTGGQLSNARDLRELLEGVLLEGRGFDYQWVANGWRFRHVYAIGDRDWIDDQKIYDALKAQGRIIDPLSAAGAPAGAPAATTSKESPRQPGTAKVRKGPRSAPGKTGPTRKRKAGRTVRGTERAGKMSASRKRKASPATRRTRKGER